MTSKVVPLWPTHSLSAPLKLHGGPPPLRPTDRTGAGVQIGSHHVLARDAPQGGNGNANGGIVPLPLEKNEMGISIKEIIKKVESFYFDQEKTNIILLNVADFSASRLKKNIHKKTLRCPTL